MIAFQLNYVSYGEHIKHHNVFTIHCIFDTDLLPVNSLQYTLILVFYPMLCYFLIKI